jgi:hypothetical protein
MVRTLGEPFEGLNGRPPSKCSAQLCLPGPPRDSASESLGIAFSFYEAAAKGSSHDCEPQNPKKSTFPSFPSRFLMERASEAKFQPCIASLYQSPAGHLLAAL